MTGDRCLRFWSSFAGNDILQYARGNVYEGRVVITEENCTKESANSKLAVYSIVVAWPSKDLRGEAHPYCRLLRREGTRASVGVGLCRINPPVTLGSQIPTSYEMWLNVSASTDYIGAFLPTSRFKRLAGKFGAARGCGSHLT